ncbi:hypothetical protein TNCV_768791 [Trichonephila clavipes]|nr:hypothetical protein TNCV_768791 [Trichonephila clavipes]
MEDDCLVIDHRVKAVKRKDEIKFGEESEGIAEFDEPFLLFSNDNTLRSIRTAGSDVVQSGRSIFDDFFQHLWPYIGNNTANVFFQMVKRLWLIRIDQ